ncbi:MAG: M23 family metallopeptidase [Bacteroidota bacterium]
MANREQNLWERLRYNYRLVILNNETFKEMGSYRVSLLRTGLLLGFFLVFLLTGTWLTIALTPLREYVPGYEKTEDYQTELLELQETINLLEKKLEQNDNRMSGLVRFVEQKGETAEDLATEENETDNIAVSVNTNAADSTLRREIAMEDVGLEAKQLRRTINFSNNRSPEQLYLIPPIKGNLSKGYDPDQKHYGIDFTAPQNTPILTVLDGYVFFADWTMETGNTIGIQHADNIVTFYKHNSLLLKEVGDYVKAGEAIAVIGNTGVKTDGPQLHFELWIRGRHVNPAEYFTFGAIES